MTIRRKVQSPQPLEDGIVIGEKILLDDGWATVVGVEDEGATMVLVTLERADGSKDQRWFMKTW